MGGKALKKIGIETERKSTSDLYKIFNNLKGYFQEYEIVMTKFYKNKKDHGDLDILIKTNNVDRLKNLIENKIKTKGLLTNDSVISFEYENFQIDLICIDPKIWETAVIYYSNDPFANLMGKIAKGFGLTYGKDGLYCKLIGKRGSKKILLSIDNEEIFKFLGYNFNEFKKGFNTIEEIFDFISNGEFFDKSLFEPKNLTNHDRKRSMKRPSFRKFLERNTESKFHFKEKEFYIDYINDWFPGFKKELEKFFQIDDLKLSINKKFRQILYSFKKDRTLGNVIYYYKLIKKDFDSFIINNDINKILDDFTIFYKRYIELQKMVDEKLGFGKKMGNDIYIHKNYEFYIPKNILQNAKRLLPENFNYTIIKWNIKDNSISFIKSNDFNISNEPTIDDSFKVIDNKIKYRSKPKKDQIYHHKWMFVKPSYKGFNYVNSILRSLKWYKNFNYDSKKIGYKDYWEKLNINEKYNISDIEIANKTSRVFKNTGAIGKNAIVPKYVEKIIKKSDLILDFGSGKYPLHAIKLKNKGYNVKSHEFGNNLNPDLHDIDALNYKYDIIYASNVLNVQSNVDMLKITLKEIYNILKNDGLFIANYPLSPRKMNLNYKDIKNIINNYFNIDDLGNNLMLMRKKKLNENMKNDNFLKNYESFIMIIRNHDLKNKSNVKEIIYNSHGINITNKNNISNKYIKPYEKNTM